VGGWVVKRRRETERERRRETDGEKERHGEGEKGKRRERESRHFLSRFLPVPGLGVVLGEAPRGCSALGAGVAPGLLLKGDVGVGVDVATVDADVGGVLLGLGRQSAAKTLRDGLRLELLDCRGGGTEGKGAGVLVQVRVRERKGETKKERKVDGNTDIQREIQMERDRDRE